LRGQGVEPLKIGGDIEIRLLFLSNQQSRFSQVEVVIRGVEQLGETFSR
jgi:hypothetical protein